MMKSSFVLYLSLLSFVYSSCTSKGESHKLPKQSNAAQEEQAKLQGYASKAAAYAKSNGFNTRFCFLVDMERSSGTNRFIVYDFEKGKVDTAGLVAHGRCNKLWLVGRKYSNKINSGCTSLGRYKIGKPYQGRFGLAYKLYGLDPTNNNAFQRYVVLHAHECVPAKEVSPLQICQSDGCPTVATTFLTLLAKKIDKSPKPVLLWIFE